MKQSIFFVFVSMLLFSFPGETAAQQQNYNGTFLVTTGDITLTLTIRQEGSNVVKGTLQSSNGAQYTLEGVVSEGIAAGALSGSEGSLYFEAYLDENDLTLSLIEPDQYNMPNYDSAEYLVMSRSGSSAIQPQAQYPSQQHKQSPSQPQQQSPPQPSTAVKPGTEVVRDEMNGYSFTLPDGWVYQKGDGQILMGSNTIPGLISVFPHQAGNMQEMQGLMHQGIQEEGVYLSLDAGIQQRGPNMVTGYYNGSVQGEQARGYGIGLLSQYGGGIFVLAVSTPQKLGQEIISSVDFLAQNTRFTKRVTGSQDLVRHFSGEWAWTNGYRTEWMTFYPDGTYSDQSEASYSGNMTDGSGNITGNWGATGQDSNMGRWSIQGNRDSGVITVINPDGSQNRYEYKVFVERGEKYYREYLLNGYHYTKQKDF
jgi:hypothetical protein